MTNNELGSVILGLLLLMLAANLLGQFFARLRQPKVVGEILAGILLGPSVLGHFAPGVMHDVFGSGAKDPKAVVLAFMYNLGLLLLMFVSGASVRHVLGKENRKPTAWILAIGTPLPFFLALAVTPLLPLHAFMGTANIRSALTLVFAAAATVTSIPVITKIFSDLGILHTRFASIMLGAAVLEDIALWGVMAVATAIASATIASAGTTLTSTISDHVAVSTAYVIVALTLAPMLLRKASRWTGNVLANDTPIAWILAVFLGYIAVAAALQVNTVFAAFLAGFGIVGGSNGTERHRFRASLDSITHLGHAFFVPVYFAIVGYKLDLTKTFSPWMLAGFLLGSSALCFLTVGAGARLAGFRGLAVFNIAITENARGGPGIVLASVAYDAHIINGPFFTTLVLTAVLTSQACGWWLGYVLRKGWPLLGTRQNEAADDVTFPAPLDDPMMVEPI
jgi:Kef-type K+ transport system membrane component KefB